MHHIHTFTPCNTGTHSQCNWPIYAVFTHATAHGHTSPSSPCNTGAHSLSPLVLAMQLAHMCCIHTCHGPKSHMSPSSRLYQYSIIHLVPPRQESSRISGPVNTVPWYFSSPVSLPGHLERSPGFFSRPCKARVGHIYFLTPPASFFQLGSQGFKCSEMGFH